MAFYKKIMIIHAFLLVCIAIRLEARPLNVLFVVAYFPAPSQTYILNLMTGLLDHGHNISILSFLKKKCENPHPNIEEYSLMDHVIYGTESQLPNCDIVFCQSATLANRMLKNKALQQWLADKKIAVCLRGHDITKNSLKKDSNLYAELFERAHLFLPVCDYFKQLLIKLGCPVEKIIVHHSGIDGSQFFFKERKKPEKGYIRFVSVCRLIEKKGLEYALQAFATVFKEYKNILFTIIGDGPLKVKLRKLIKKLKLEKKIILFGWGNQDQIVKILNQSHIFLLPSITAQNGDEEGIANALKEAMAMGLVTVGSWHAGTPELIADGESGFLVPQKNSQALASKIKYIIEHPEIWRAIGITARLKIEDEFESKKIVKQLEQLFYELIR